MTKEKFKSLHIGTRLRLVPWKNALRRRNRLGLPRLPKIGGVSREDWDRWVKMETYEESSRWVKRLSDNNDNLERCSYYIPFYAIEADKE